MNNIKISICASSIYQHLWTEFLNSLRNNTIPYEVIFAGDVKPQFDLSKYPEFKWIYTTVKPAQVYEFCFRCSKGELVSWSADEAVYNNGALDKMYKFHKSFNERKLITGFTVYEHNDVALNETSSGHRLSTPDTPRMMCFGVIKKEYLRSLGGYDKYFITGQAENDLCMRVYEDGGKCELCPEAKVYVYHNKAHKDGFEDSKFRKWYSESRKRLNESWFIDGVWTPTRVRPFVPFDDEKILQESQGPKGGWS